MGVFSVVSGVVQIALCTLLCIISLENTTNSYNLVTWSKFLGGTQGALAVAVSILLSGAVIVTMCCNKEHRPRDNTVDVYHPRQSSDIDS